MYDYSKGNSFEEILARCLARVDDNLDKRQGSIIYDALAPACAELAQAYIALDVYTHQTYLPTAVGTNLDNRVVDYGLTRKPATYSQRALIVYDKNTALMDIDIGSRFSVPNEYGGYNYTVIEETDLGHYIVQCETAGAVGNNYIGEVLPLVYINNLGNAVLGEVIKPGEDTETDEELRKRAIDKINQEAFAGNKAAYTRMIEDIDGVEVCKVFPVWNGGGTVKLAVLASDYTIPTTTFIQELQEMIDPIISLTYTCDGTETGICYFTYNGSNYEFTMPTVEEGDILTFDTGTSTLYKGTTAITTTSGTSGTELLFTEVPSGQGVGLAPIGHTVTVEAPTQLDIDISATLTLETGYTISQLQTAIENSINAYIEDVQKTWADEDTLIIYISKITAAILTVSQVKNVSSLTINSAATDLTINITANNIQFPMLGDVVLSES